MMLLDLVICTTPRGKSTEENVQFTSKVFELINNVKRLNRELYKLDHLFYLLEFPSCIKDRIPLHDSFHCVWEPTNVHVCNWPIPPKIERLVGLGASENLSGQQEDYLRQGTSLLAAAPLLHGKFRILMFLLCSHILAHNSHACFTYTSDDALRFLTRSIVRRTGAEEEVEGYHTSKILGVPWSWA